MTPLFALVNGETSLRLSLATLEEVFGVEERPKCSFCLAKTVTSDSSIERCTDSKVVLIPSGPSTCTAGLEELVRTGARCHQQFTGHSRKRRTHAFADVRSHPGDHDPPAGHVDRRGSGRQCVAPARKASDRPTSLR